MTFEDEEVEARDTTTRRVENQPVVVRVNTVNFEMEVLQKLGRLETKIDMLVGNGQPGRVKLIEDRVVALEHSDIQAVLQACDHGLVEVGEKVIAVTGDSAAVITASSTGKFLTRDEGLAVHEIICKPKNLTIARGKPAVAVEQSRSLFEPQPTPRLTASTPKPAPATIEGEITGETGLSQQGKRRTKGQSEPAR